MKVREFKCRRCGEVFRIPESPMEPQTWLHHCARGGMGVADLIGFDEVEDKEEDDQ